VFPDMPGEQYHALEAFSASGAKKLLRSPQHFRAERDAPAEPSPAMEFGSSVHCGVLESAHFDARVVRGERFDKRTTVGKAAHAAFQQEHAGKIVLGHDDYERALRCIES